MPSAASSSHCAKRPFQPSITSFFARSQSNGSTQSHSSVSSDTLRSEHETPASIQSSLLNVGMRVRKSVPEGYKTHKTVLFSNHRPDPNATIHSHTVAATQSSEDSSIHQRPPELTPFCGLHKVGGLDVPQTYGPSFAPEFFSHATESSFGAPTGVFAGSALGFWPADGGSDGTPFSSQDSNVSTDSTALTGHIAAAHPLLNGSAGMDLGSVGRKRGFQDFDDDDEDLFNSLDPSFDSGTSTGFDMYDITIDETHVPIISSSTPARRTAWPRGSRPVRGKTRAFNGAQGSSFGHGMTEFDFEDAAFLLPPGEVHMS